MKVRYGWAVGGVLVLAAGAARGADAGSEGAVKGGAPVAEYHATSDREVHAKPELMKMQAAGTSLVDPTFGCRILRVTDGDTNPAAKGLSYQSPARTGHNPFNADSTKFYIAGQAGGNVILFDFDTKKFTATPLKDARGGMLMVPLWSGYFSHTDPNILFGASQRGRRIEEYNVATGQTSLIADLDKIQPSEGAVHVLSADYTDTLFATAFGGMQDSHPYEVVYNRKSKEATVLDVKNSKVKKFGAADYGPLNMELGGGIHASCISADGRWVTFECVLRGPGGVPGGNHLIWDTKEGKVFKMPLEGGHSALGFGTFINQPGNGHEGYGWTIRPLDDLEHPKQLLSLRKGETVWGDSHPSWNNEKPGKLLPFVTECYLRDGTVHGAWDEEIVAVATDGSDKVWRFCHHRSSAFEEFWDTPRASVSQDGKYAMFTSTWEGTLGEAMTPPGPARPAATGGGKAMPRRDVFIVRLEQEAGFKGAGGK